MDDGERERSRFVSAGWVCVRVRFLFSAFANLSQDMYINIYLKQEKLFKFYA